MKDKFSHLTPTGDPTMVDVGNKKVTNRTAIAKATIKMHPEIIIALKEEGGLSKKGPVFHTAILAGIMGSKKTSDLIPLCHPLPMSKCEVKIGFHGEDSIEILCTAKVEGKTGVEMEALTGASIAALTIYDMCKAYSHEMEISTIHLIEKTGGKSVFKK
jgi:cyclic pyranopterin phosphate synthase